MGKPLGMLQWTEGTLGKDLIANTQRFEELGYDELWLPEAFGRETLSTCGFLLAKTTTLNVSSGIATIYGRDADAAAQAANGLAELSDGRFRLGLGVSHPVLVEPRGHTWGKPVPQMRAFLQRVHEAPIESPLADDKPKVICAGHGPGLMRVARDLSDGSFLFLQPIEAVRTAREILGPEKELHVTVRCVLEADQSKARELARRASAFYISLPAYQARWAEHGYEAADWETGGSDRLIDSITVWGDAKMIAAKLEAFFDAGATHVVLYPANPDEDYAPGSAYSKNWNWPLLEALAP
ncbi:MAG: LLM class flavin-dependent oxidoreductase [Pseudomonadota bacterium]